MRTLIVLGLALIALPAHAEEPAPGSLTVAKRGILPTWVWVDGQPHGKVKKKKPLDLRLSAGRHEVWYAGDPDGIVTLCHGVVDIQPARRSMTEYRDRGCEGLGMGWPDGPSAFKGAEVRFRVDDAVDAWVSIDGGQRYAFPDMPFSLNLAPGQHTFVLYTDVMDGNVFDQGTVTLGPGDMLAVTCTTAGCVGFDQPPVFITELHQAPHIQVATPGVSIQMNVDVDGGGQGAGMSMGVSIQDDEGGVSVGAGVEVRE